jgi:capsular polysaccharide biosynthesis protein
VNESFPSILRRWWWVPAVMLGVGVAAGVWWTSLQPQVYRASAMLAVVPTSEVGDAEVLRSLDALERRTLLATFARLPGTPRSRMAIAAAVQKDLRDLASYEIGASVLPSTNIIRVDVDGPDPRLAADLANAAGIVAAADARSLYRIYTMRSIADADPPPGLLGPDVRRNSLAAGVAGLFIGTLALGVISGRGRQRDSTQG